MPLAFILIVGVIIIVLWFLLSCLFPMVGSLFYEIFKDTEYNIKKGEIINKSEENSNNDTNNKNKD